MASESASTTLPSSALSAPCSTSLPTFGRLNALASGKLTNASIVESPSVEARSLSISLRAPAIFSPKSSSIPEFLTCMGAGTISDSDFDVLAGITGASSSLGEAFASTTSGSLFRPFSTNTLSSMLTCCALCSFTNLPRLANLESSIGQLPNNTILLPPNRVASEIISDAIFSGSEVSESEKHPTTSRLLLQRRIFCLSRCPKRSELTIFVTNGAPATRISSVGL